MRFEDDWDDLFDVRIGPFGMGAFLGPRPFRVKYSRTSDSHLLRLRISKGVEKGDIKVRFIEKGLIEIEWPRRTQGEEIPVE